MPGIDYSELQRKLTEAISCSSNSYSAKQYCVTKDILNSFCFSIFMFLLNHFAGLQENSFEPEIDNILR